MSLRFTADVPERGVSVAFDLAQGHTLGITGPNGAGKSTVLDVLAGLLIPHTGRAELGVRVLFEVSDGRGLWVPPHHRGITLMAQRPSLFPHLSVLDNVAFGPRSQGLGRRAARNKAMWWLGEVGAEQFATRRPDSLSGGQAQRVALARALAAEPGVLLLDEPLAPVDATGRSELRALLARVLKGRSAVVVSHDPRDVEELTDAVMELTPSPSVYNTV